jgi:hypothetical protein
MAIRADSHGAVRMGAVKRFSGLNRPVWGLNEKRETGRVSAAQFGMVLS